MIPYPEDLVDANLFERARARLNEAMANRDRVRAGAVDAAAALKNAETERDKLVLKASKEGGIHAGESLAANQAVKDAEAHQAFLRDALGSAEAEIVAAQKALDAASGDAHLPVLQHAIELRVEAAAELDRLELELAEARAKYFDAGDMAALATQRGARCQHMPLIYKGPYGRHPGEHEAAERLAWGRTPAGV